MKVGVFIAMCIVIPYASFTAQIGKYISENRPEGVILPDCYNEAPIVFCAALGYILARSAFRVLFRKQILKIVPTRQSGSSEPLSEAEREAKAAKIEGHIIDSLAYGSFTVSAYYLCMDKEWFPWWLGGHGELHLWNKGLPFIESNHALIYLGYINAGYRIENLYQHLMHHRGDSDFEEMLLHDIVTVFLFFGYLVGNLVPIGTMIALLHDVCDVPFHTSKALNTSIWPEYAVGPYVLGQLLWIWLRLVGFAIIIYSVYTTEYTEPLAHFQVQMTMNTVYLGSLYSLHWIWFLMFQRLNLKLIRGA